MSIIAHLPATLPREPLPPNTVAVSRKGAKYTLSSLLGEGAAGAVYLGSLTTENGDTRNRRYAIKILCPLQRIAQTEDGYDRIARRFHAEGTRGAKLRHTNLIDIVDFGKVKSATPLWNHAPFIAMSFIEGDSADKLLLESAPPLSLRYKWVVQISDAVNYLHQRNIVHRDVKPHNIIITRPNRDAVLGDFGVVHWGDFRNDYSGGVTTTSGEILSTWSYLPPEIEIENATYDLSAEMWAFGKTALEFISWQMIPRGSLLTGKTPTIDKMLLSLLDNDPLKRAQIGVIRARFAYLLHLCEGFEGITEDNYVEAANALARYRPYNPGCFDFQGAYDRIMTKHTATYFSYKDDHCPKCGSPFVVLMCLQDGTPEWDNVEYFIRHYVCLGKPTRPCGEIWTESTE